MSSGIEEVWGAGASDAAVGNLYGISVLWGNRSWKY